MVDSESDLNTNVDTDSDTGTSTGTDPEPVVHGYYEYVDAEQYDDLVALFADGVRYEHPGQGAITGRKERREFYCSGRPLEDGSHEVHDVVVEGNTVAVRGSFSGVQGGERVAFDFADFTNSRTERSRDVTRSRTETRYNCSRARDEGNRLRIRGSEIVESRLAALAAVDVR